MREEQKESFFTVESLASFFCAFQPDSVAVVCCAEVLSRPRRLRELVGTQLRMNSTNWIFTVENGLLAQCAQRLRVYTPQDCILHGLHSTQDGALLVLHADCKCSLRSCALDLQEL